MKKLIHLRFTALAMLMSLFTILGCENKEEAPSIAPEKESQITYVYNGESFLVRYKEKNGEYTILDQSIGNKIKAVLDGPTSTTLIDLSDTNTVYIFDNKEDCDIYLKEITKNSRKSTPNARESNSPLAAYGNVYEHDDFLGARLDYTGYSVYSDLSTIGWNDRISSISLNADTGTNAEAVFCEDPNFGGRQLRMLAYGRYGGISIHYSDLDKVRFGGIFGQKYHWNDRISSFYILIVE